MTTKELLIQKINSMSETELLEILNLVRTIKHKHSKYLPKSHNTEEREEWVNLSLQNLNKCYSDNEPEYSLESIKEHNPDYERR